MPRFVRCGHRMFRYSDGESGCTVTSVSGCCGGLSVYRCAVMLYIYYSTQKAGFQPVFIISGGKTQKMAGAYKIFHFL